ncbi:hypothetical protein BT96DRAFT_1008128 [Gymnopus androsaceus JB14]|uniref:Uncharacterized protein n=1 Tax=Gymnopus androsaceus JB14 TaxID=1447944 RepID=A0A6A4GFZ6_9AGAR|nr:hypothetical protein BT96DRAFT_1008128 [Gymnopus androsaceus JB14]
MVREPRKADNLSPRWKAALNLFKSQVIRHVDIRNNALEALEFLTRLPLHYLGELPESQPSYSRAAVVKIAHHRVWLCFAVGRYTRYANARPCYSQ